MAYESPLTIAEVMQDISVNKYVLPSIQREYVWGTTQIERLFDSIMQDYPIGAFLFWELSNGQHSLYEFYSFLQKYHEKKCRHKGTSKTIVFTDDDIENLLEHQYGKGETLTILMLLYPSLDFNNKFHIDHMYPKSIFTKKNLMKKGIPADKVQSYIDHVNDLSNLQLLAAIPNIEKQNQDFAEWFKSTYKKESDKIQYRMIHYLPDMEYSYANFEAFLQERRKKLKAQLEKMLL